MVHDDEDKINSKEKIRWSCRRGMLELDKILIPFFDDNYDSMGKDGRKLFVQLLEQSDQKLYDWLFKGEIPNESRLHDLVLLIKYSSKSKDCKALESV